MNRNENSVLLARVAPLILLLTSACSVADLVAESEREADRAVAALCDACIASEAERDECEADFAWRPYEDAECVVEALDIDKQRSRETLECVLEVQRDYTACVKREFMCDPDSYAACEALKDGVRDCPELPPSVVEALLRCR